MRANKDFQILVVDDEIFNRELVGAFLEEEEYTCFFAQSAQEAIEKILVQNIDLILLDINMPKVDGFTLCKILKEDTKTEDIPVIFLTAQTDIEYIAKGFKVGGVDYISKPFSGIELKARVKTQLEKVEYLDDIKQKQSRLAQLSITDPLTKLYNGLFFDSQIKSYQNRAETFWIIYIKIDNFTKINQLYGYHVSNKIINEVSKIIQESVYKNAVTARLFGVSFGVLLKDYERQKIGALYEAILLALKKHKDLKNAITISAVLYNSQDTTLGIPGVYKKLLKGMQNFESSDANSFLFID